MDNSGEINRNDAQLILRNSLNISMIGTVWQSTDTTGDVDCDGIVNASDALLLLRYSLGLSTQGTPWCEQ